MLKSIVKALGFIACLALSGAVCAVGMGGINVTTALGEPLKAEIELVAVGKAEKSSLSARLASSDIFKGAGMDYPSGMSTLKFQVETRANGEPYIRVTSAQPMKEPFVSLLVELSWSSGRLLREYTFLLDPPGYKSGQPKAEEVKPVVPSVEAASSVATSPMRATAPMGEKVFSEAAISTGKHNEGGNIASGSIKVKRGDSLSKIALQSKPSDVSLERMLVALYRANTDAFDGNNMNRLKIGKILQMPASQGLDKLGQVDAIKEIRVQVADWHAYRQKLASASGAVAEHAPKQEASGKISTTLADKAPAAKESAKEVVRLSKGAAPGDKVATDGNAKALQDKVHTMEEEAIARGKVLKESNERIVLLEKNIKEMQHLIELKGQSVALAKPVLGKVEAPVETKPASAKADATAPTSAPVAVSAVAAASAIASASAVKPAVKPVAAPKVVPPPPSLLDEPLYLAGGAAVLLALGGIGLMLARRDKGGKAKKKIPGSSRAAAEDITIGHISTPVAPSPETGDFTQTAIATPINLIQPEDIDPINEADLFLSFGRDVQAEEILKDALEKKPASNPTRLKLLSIYANRKDTMSFSVIALQVQNSGDAAAWAQAAEMGRNLDPSNPIYGGTGGEPIIAATVDQDKSGQQQVAELDFDLGFGEQAATPENESTVVPSEKTANMPELDFDLGSNESGLSEANAVEDIASAMVPGAPSGENVMDMPLADLHAVQETPIDFDITANLDVPEPVSAAAAITPDLDDLVFDITATHSSPAAIVEEKPAADVSGGADDALAFTLDFPATTEPVTAQAAAKKSMDIDLSGISLDMSEPISPVSTPVAEVKDAHWHDVATKLDLSKAYQEMGDNAGAREILEEVLAEGDDQQRAMAEEILQQLPT